jgi:MFS family permease
VLEVPSGVLADRTSRRALLVAGPLLAATGFAAWVAAPSYPVFAAGFVLWGACGALQSGALEALAYTELDRHGAAGRYAHVMGRVHALGTAASALAMGLAAPVLAAGGFTALGVASVLACLAAAAAGAALPEHRGAVRDEPGDARPLRAGLAAIRSTPGLAGAVLLVPAVAAIWGALDEFLPLLAAQTGVPADRVPLLALAVYLGVAAGGVLGARAAALSRRALAALLTAAAVALAIGAGSGRAEGFALIAAAFGAFQAATVAVEVRLQQAITGPARATVTSLAGLGTELVVLAVYATYGAGSALASHRVLFAAFAAVYVLVALAQTKRTKLAAPTTRQ